VARRTLAEVDTHLVRTVVQEQWHGQ
jgi:hypothetical protein